MCKNWEREGWKLMVRGRGKEWLARRGKEGIVFWG